MGASALASDEPPHASHAPVVMAEMLLVNLRVTRLKRLRPKAKRK
jgi:hypothetical protein